MNKQKVISVLQSRIAERGKSLKTGWHNFGDKEYKHDRRFLKIRMINLGTEQKVDKALLKLVQSPFDTGFAVGYREACKAVKLTLEACECQN